MATLTLPKKLTRPVTAKAGYWATGTVYPGKPAGKEHKTHGEQGANLRKAGEGRNDHLHRGFGVCRTQGALPQQFFTAFDQEGQDNQRTARGKRRDQHVARLPDDLPVGQRGAARNQGRQYPEGEHQGDGDIGHQIDLELAQILQTHGAGGAGHHRKDANRASVWTTKSCHLRDRPVEDGEVGQQALFLLNANEGQANGHTEQHDRGHNVVGERVERIGRNEQGEKVDLFGLVDPAMY